MFVDFVSSTVIALKPLVHLILYLICPNAIKIPLFASQKMQFMKYEYYNFNFSDSLYLESEYENFSF